MRACSTVGPSSSISTDDDTVVLQADFYRAGDGNEESFTANMIVSTQDLDGDPPRRLCRTSGCRASVAAPPSQFS